MAEWKVLLTKEELTPEELAAQRAAHRRVCLAGDPSQGQPSNLGPDPSSSVGNAGVTAQPSSSRGRREGKWVEFLVGFICSTPGLLPRANPNREGAGEVCAAAV